MKKINRLIPMAMAFLLLFPALNVQAAPWKKNQQEPKATISELNGTVVMSLEQINSMEGTFKVVEKPKNGNALVEAVNVTCSDLGAQGMVKNDKVFLYSSGTPMNAKLEISMKFTAAGVYKLELDGGVTNADGVYEDYSLDSKNCICQIEIEVKGASAGDSSAGNSSGGNFNYNSEFELNINVKTDELEDALEEVADAIKSDEQLAMMQELLNKMNQGLALLEGGDQASVDKVAEELQDSLEKLEIESKEESDAELEAEIEQEEVKEVEVTSDEETKKQGSKLPLILPVFILFLAAGAAAYYYRKKTRHNVPDYDGAPMIDYDIEDDDE